MTAQHPPTNKRKKGREPMSGLCPPLLRLTGVKPAAHEPEACALRCLREFGLRH